MKIENPFSDKGEQIPAKYFIGRGAEIRTGQPTNIENSIFRYELLAPLAIIGIPGIGKSSLARKAITERKKELNDRKVLPIEITVFPHDTSQEFFRKFVIKCVAEMEKVGCCTPEVKESKDSLVKTLNHTGVHTLPQPEIESFFETVKTTEYRPLFILDQFDAAQSALKDTNAFYILNALTQTHDFISLVLIARQDIAKIEDNAGSQSAFNRLFQQPIRLSMFSETDLETDYFSKLEAVLKISADEKENIRFHCGAHPYLLQKLGFQIVKRLFETDAIDVSQSIKDIFNIFSSYYDRLTTFLEEVNLLTPLLQVLYDVDIDPTDLDELKPDLDKLKHYGLIKETKTGSYVAYSEHFHNYLQKQYEFSAKSSSMTNATDLTGPVDIRFTEKQFVPFEEDPFHEFKDISKSQRPDRSIGNTADEYAVAFLNCNGGRIFWGIDDSGRIVGVSLDTEQRDNVRKLVSEQITEITPSVSIENYKLEFHDVYNSMEEAIDDLWVVELVVSPPQKIDIFYTKSYELFVKTDGGRKKLAGPAATAFIQSKEKLAG